MMIVNNIARTLAVLSLATSSLFVFPTGSDSFAQSNNNRITGYAWGKITEFISRPRYGDPNQGTLAVGGTSTEPYVHRINRTVTRSVNPLKFSTESAEFVNRVNMNENVWIAFDRSMVVREVQPVTKKSPAVCATQKVSRQAGDVRRSVQGSIALVREIPKDEKTPYEAYLVQGTSTRFKRIYIADAGLYRCAIDAVKSGQLVTVNYSDVQYGPGIFSYTLPFIDSIAPTR